MLMDWKKALLIVEIDQVKKIVVKADKLKWEYEY